MKKISTAICLLLLTGKMFSQGTIQGFTVVPAAPTTTDNVVVYVDLQFSSMGCAKDYQAHSTAGTTTSASAHHCLGMLSAICNTTDTFNLGMLPAGVHSFQLTLSSGFGGPGCSPGIVPDDMDSVSFVVSPGVGIDEAYTSSGIVVSPNPSHGSATFAIGSSITFGKAALSVTDVCGKLIKKVEGIESKEFSFDLQDLPKGIYFYQLNEGTRLLGTGKFIVE